MVAESREHRHVGEEILDHLYTLPHRLQVGFPRCVPDVVWYEVTRPDDEVQVLKGRTRRGID